MFNREKLDNLLLELGFAENLTGTRLIRDAAELYHPGCSVVKGLYAALAVAHSTTPARAERAIRHAIEVAWMRGNVDAQRRIFGYTVNPSKGVPTNSELISRLARLCYAD